MDLQTLTFVFVGATFALYIVIAIWSKARNTDDFYVAGGDVSSVANRSEERRVGKECRSRWSPYH